MTEHCNIISATSEEKVTEIKNTNKIQTVSELIQQGIEMLLRRIIF